MMENVYRQKYLKYKQKYLDGKMLKGGDLDAIKSKMRDAHDDVLRQVAARLHDRLREGRLGPQEGVGPQADVVDRARGGEGEEQLHVRGLAHAVGVEARRPDLDGGPRGRRDDLAACARAHRTGTTRASWRRALDASSWRAACRARPPSRGAPAPSTPP